MCGIFGVISTGKLNIKNLKILAEHSRQRGKDSSGYISYKEGNYKIKRFDYDLKKSIKFIDKSSKLIFGHSRLVTNSMVDNQPLYKNKVCVIHNGIITNYKALYKKFKFNQKLKIDTEIISDLINYYYEEDKNLTKVIEKTLSTIKGTASCVVSFIELGKTVLFSNNGSLYYGEKNDDIYISSEYFPLNKIGLNKIEKVIRPIVLDIPKSSTSVNITEDRINRTNLVPDIIKLAKTETILKFKDNKIKRCNKCILPINFPFIELDEKGICNFCNNYNKKYNNFDENKKEFFLKILEKYKSKKNNLNCIFPLSGGRDSCYGLHLATKELGIKPVTFTYDWGLVTDLARRNISRMCSILNVENIIVADNIFKKRSNIKKNVLAWLNKPHLGMVNLFTAGDKHFYRFLEKIKKQNSIDLNIWSYNPFEITHFKHGFLGVEPNFSNKKTYNQGILSQLDYQLKRLRVMMGNWSYFNSSIFDTLVGEFNRSIKKHHDYYYLFDYFLWDENKINSTLLGDYDWEKSVDTDSTWRIGDGAAPFYNYIFYTMAGFTEFDTFRSNQIREGLITRETAINLVKLENKPRYQSIKWFLDVIDLDFEKTINRINEFSYFKD